MAFPIYENDNYIMRELTLSDAGDVYNYMSERDVMRYTASPVHTSIEDTLKVIKKLSSSFSEGAGIAWAIAEKHSNQVIGNIGLYYTTNTKEYASVGYNISPRYQNMGIATWALGNCLDYGLNQRKLASIEANCKSVNAASERVMQKCGMRLKEINKSPFLVDGIYYDIKTYTISI